MAGTALAFTIGGMLNDSVHATAPFFVALALCFLCTIQTYLVLPYVAPKYTEGDVSKQDGEKRKKNKKRSKQSIKKTVEEQIKGFFRPLKVFKTRRLEDWDGKSYHGVTLLAIGTFVSVLATAYVVSYDACAIRLTLNIQADPPSTTIILLHEPSPSCCNFSVPIFTDSVRLRQVHWTGSRCSAC
jgi:hypothetical protein